MSDALRSIFGDWIGLIGLAVMFVILAPKMLTRWRGFRQRKRGEDSEIVNALRGTRALSYQGTKPTIKAHDEFGAACAIMNSRRLYILICSIAWIAPFIINYSIPKEFGIRFALFYLTIPLLIIGLFRLFHIIDKAIFYEKGFVIRYGLSRRSIDYNAVIDIQRRASMINAATTNYIFHIENESPVDFICANYSDKARTVARVIKGLEPRKTRSAAIELARKREG